MEQHSGRSENAAGIQGMNVSVGKRTPSPSGRYHAELVPVDAQAPADRQMLRVRITPSASAHATFESVTAFAAWFRLRVQWDADDRLWADSSDVGIRLWALYNGRWTEFHWQSDGPKVPDPTRVVWDVELKQDVFILGIEPPPQMRGIGASRRK